MPGIMLLSSARLFRGYSFESLTPVEEMSPFEDDAPVTGILDTLVDGMLESTFRSLPDGGDPVPPAPAPVPVVQAGIIIKDASKVPRSMHLYELESKLVAKLSDPDSVFSPEELIRLANVVASIPSSADHTLQNLRTKMMAHPDLSDFRSSYHVPTWKRIMPDGSLSRNNCNPAARHSRMIDSMVLALCVAYHSRTSTGSLHLLIDPGQCSLLGFLLGITG